MNHDFEIETAHLNHTEFDLQQRRRTAKQSLCPLNEHCFTTGNNALNDE